MRMLCVAAATLLLATSAAASKPGRSRSFVLATIPSVGTVTWRCDVPSGRYGLAFRLAPISATTAVTLTAPHFHEVRTLQPEERVSLPLTRVGTERVVAVQGTEARTLHATVTATFDRGRGYCFSYFPPRVSMRAGW
jgi:hypothetical protein